MSAQLGRVKTLGREEQVERRSSPATMSSQAMASPLGNRGTGRTRFPSVDVLSEFSHSQGPSSDEVWAPDQARPLVSSSLTSWRTAPWTGSCFGLSNRPPRRRRRGAGRALRRPRCCRPWCGLARPPISGLCEAELAGVDGARKADDAQNVRQDIHRALRPGRGDFRSLRV